MKILVDTDILIDYSKGYSHLLEDLLAKQLQGNLELYVNPIIIAEFFTDNNLKDKRKFNQALEFFNLFNTLEINKKIGLITGEILRKKQAHFLGDALIAASCLVNDLRLATGNKKHFTLIKGLQFYPV